MWFFRTKRFSGSLSEKCKAEREGIVVPRTLRRLVHKLHNVSYVIDKPYSAPASQHGPHISWVQFRPTTVSIAHIQNRCDQLVASLVILAA